MKLYCAAPWNDKAHMPVIAKRFEDGGHTITYKWWDTEDIAESEKTVLALRSQAEKDVAGVKAADIVVVLNTAKSEGKSVEQGVAVALGKPIMAVGKRGEFSANVFHYLKHYYWLDTIDDAIVALDLIKWLAEDQPNASGS